MLFSSYKKEKNMKCDHHPITKRIRNEVYKEKKLQAEIYYGDLMEEHKFQLIFQRKKELEQLKKRIKYLEMELEGMGVRDFELTQEEIRRKEW
jgi:hypothetical protein